MNLKPCPRFYTNTPWQQFRHIASELTEVAKALYRKDSATVAEELVDLQTSCETMLVIMGLNDRKRAAVRRLVVDKNWQRGYYASAPCDTFASQKDKPL
jgi:NTP pyrophosphatase (non-canonical NTP hydrolase)